MAHTAGLDCFDGAASSFVHHREVGEQVNVTYEDSAGTLWVGTALEDGTGALRIGTEEPGTLSRLDVATDSFTVYDSSSPAGLASTYGIRAILEDRDGSLWLGACSRLVHF